MVIRIPYVFRELFEFMRLCHRPLHGVHASQPQPPDFYHLIINLFHIDQTAVLTVEYALHLFWWDMVLLQLPNVVFHLVCQLIPLLCTFTPQLKPVVVE